LVDNFLMTRKDLIKTIIKDSQSREHPNLWKRTLQLPINTGKIVTLSGVRRSGKTYHLFNLINQLLKNKVSAEKILYINFEDERLNLTTEELDQILQIYQELYPHLKLSECFFFFDEIQEVPGWEKFIARIHSSVNQNIFITGSNAKLLSKEIATALRGRSITFEVYPLSFSEFLNITSPNLDAFKSTDKAKIIGSFSRFLRQGGFPELIDRDDDLSEKILQEYFNVMVLRDLVERYKISQASILKYFCKRVVGNSAGEFSVNKIYNELKSQGYQIGKDTLYAYQGYVEAIYLARFISKYSHSVVKAEMSQKKSYVIDQGLGSAIDYKFSQDRGRLLETTIALELLKHDRQIAYQQNGSQCDFVVIDQGKVKEVIQVADNLASPETKKREIRGLMMAAKEYELKSGKIITFDQKDELSVDGINIEIIPGWEYCLQLDTSLS